MNVVYSCSDLYSELAGISLTSLLMNNKKIEEINIYIMDNGIQQSNKNKLKKTAEDYGREIQFIPLGEFLKNFDINVQKWNLSTFGRLFEASALPKLNKVLHIDCDTVINSDIEKLWDIDMSHLVIAAAPDCLSDIYRTNIGLAPQDKYLNAGVLLMNLERIRSLELEKKFINYIEKNSQFLTYVDQEVLNACVPECEKKEIDLKYNSYSIIHFLNYNQLKMVRRASNMFSIEQYNEAKNNPQIIHFTSCFLEKSRPWYSNDNHPLKKMFDYYKNKSVWKETDYWEQKRKLSSQFKQTILHILPMSTICSIVGFIHGYYIPKRNKIRQNLKGF